MKDKIDQLETRNEQQRAMIENTTGLLELALAEHAPFVSGSHHDNVDLSVAPPEELKAWLLASVEKNLYCSACGTAWPCRELKILRILRKTLNGSIPPYASEWPGNGRVKRPNTIGVTL